MRFSALRRDRARRRDRDVPARSKGLWWIARRSVYSAAVGDDADRFGAACRDRPRRSYRDAVAADAAVAGKRKDAEALPTLRRNAAVFGESHHDCRVLTAQRPNTDWVVEKTGIARHVPEHLNSRRRVHRYLLASRRGARYFGSDSRVVGVPGGPMTLIVVPGRVVISADPFAAAPAKMPTELLPCMVIVPLR